MEGGRRLLGKVFVRCGFIFNIACLTHCISEYVAEFTLCVGPSMQPTINNKSDGDIVITERISARYRKYRRGDIVIARCPYTPETMICKRIAAMAGDIIEEPSGGKEYIKVPKGHVWLLGDNSANSTDSRAYGPIPCGLVRGRVCYRVWPLKVFGKV